MTQITRYSYRLFSSRDEDAVAIFLYNDRSDVVAEVRFVVPEGAAAGRGRR